MLHTQVALCAKVLLAKLLMCLKKVVNIVNLSTQLVKLLCKDLGSDHTCLLYNTEGHWLSQGNTTKHLL